MSGPFLTTVVETSDTEGTIDYVLNGASGRFGTFVAGAGDGGLAFYDAVMGNGWEEGWGVVTAGASDTLARNVLGSSNGGAKVDWGAGTKTIFAAPVADVLNQSIMAVSATGRPAWLPAQRFWTDISATPYLVKFYDGADDIIVGSLNASTNVFLPYAGTGPLASGLGVTLNADGTLDVDISGLGSDSAPLISDVLVRDDGTGPAKLRLDDMLKVIAGLTEVTAPDADNDVLPIYSNAASAARKVKLKNIGGATLLTPQASTSGSSISFTDAAIANAKQIIITFAGVSTSGTADWEIQLGTSGGLKTSGYLGSRGYGISGNFVAAAISSGFAIAVPSAAGIVHGTVTLTKHGTSDVWVASGTLARSDGVNMPFVAGSVTLSGSITQFAIVTSDTFDAGEIGAVVVK